MRTSAVSGGGTRAVSQGATVTRSALETSTLAAACAVHPAPHASRGISPAPATTTAPRSPTATAATARRLRIGPAPVTREKIDAETGSRTASTAIDAITVDAIHESILAAVGRVLL